MIATRLARGEERLLAMRSHNPLRGAAMVDAIGDWDADAGFRNFAVRLFEHVGLRVEDLGGQRWFLRAEALRAVGFPELPEDGLTVTFDRRRALERENEGFLTLDHPMLRAALDILLGSEQGNAGFSAWESNGAKRLVLECRFVAAAIAPPALHHERFLPPTPLRVLVDHHGRGLTANDAAALDRARLLPGNPAAVLCQSAVRTRVLPVMLEAARLAAATQLDALAKAAAARMNREVTAEADRLIELAAANPHVTQDDVERHYQRRDALARAIGTATLRLDSVRLIWHAPPRV
jgi:ATP-dependent helicase HepA